MCHTSTQSSTGSYPAPSRETLGGTIDLIPSYPLLVIGSSSRGWTVTFDLQTRAAMPKDYKIFIHLEDGQGKVVAQRDQPLLHAGCPTTAWQIGESARLGGDLIVSSAWICGDEAIVAGVYDPVTGQRLQVTAGDQTAPTMSTLGRLDPCTLPKYTGRVQARTRSVSACSSSLDLMIASQMTALR